MFSARELTALRRFHGQRAASVRRGGRCGEPAAEGPVAGGLGDLPDALAGDLLHRLAQQAHPAARPEPRAEQPFGDRPTSAVSRRRRPAEAGWGSPGSVGAMTARPGRLGQGRRDRGQFVQQVPRPAAAAPVRPVPGRRRPAGGASCRPRRASARRSSATSAAVLGRLAQLVADQVLGLHPGQPDQRSVMPSPPPRCPRSGR